MDSLRNRREVWDSKRLAQNIVVRAAHPDDVAYDDDDN